MAEQISVCEEGAGRAATECQVEMDGDDGRGCFRAASAPGRARWHGARVRATSGTDS